MDVKTSFLNGNLDECIYMMQPNSFVAKGLKHIMCKLKKSFIDLSKSLGLGILVLIKSLSRMILISALTSRMCIRNVMETWWCSRYYT